VQIGEVLKGAKRKKVGWKAREGANGLKLSRSEVEDPDDGDNDEEDTARLLCRVGWRFVVLPCTCTSSSEAGVE